MKRFILPAAGLAVATALLVGPGIVSGAPKASERVSHRSAIASSPPREVSVTYDWDRYTIDPHKMFEFQEAVRRGENVVMVQPPKHLGVEPPLG